jgi:peptide/nickel transport system substrate-binding protein
VYAAFAIAAVLGIAVFLIWWLTAGSARRAADTNTGDQTATAKPSKEAIIEASLPRGGTLIGSTNALALAVEQLTGAALVRVNRGTDRAEPWLAESWAASPDNLIYTVKLRPGLTSADGSALTAEQAVKLLAGMQAAGNPLALRAIDALTIEIKFAQPFAPGLRVLDRHPQPGFGPFVEKGKGTFARNPNYWHKAADGSALPYLDGIVLTPGKPGQHDFAEDPIAAEDYEALKKVEQSGKARIFELGPGLDADALWFAPSTSEQGASRRSPEGTKADAPASAPAALRRGKSAEPDRPWLTSEAFRLAISTAVDRREYCKQVFYGACDPIAGPITPANASWFNPDLPLGRPDPQLARAMLAELGLRDRSGDGMLNDAMRRPVRFSLLIRNDVPSSARAAMFVANTLKGIGVLVDITPVSPTVLAARRQKGSYDAIYDRISLHDTDPGMNLDFWLSSGTAHIWHGARSGPPADWERQIDQLMMKTVSSFDRIERLQAFVDVQKIYYQHMPAIFFGAPHVRIMTSVRALNATPSPLRPHLLWNAEGLAALK